MLVIGIEGEQNRARAGARLRKRLQLNERAHGKRSHPFNFYWHGKEAGPAVGNGGETAHMLDDGNVGSEQRGMDRPGAIIDRIDVEGVDPDESYAGIDELFGQFPGQMRMAFEVLISAPVGVPTSVEK